MVPICDVLTAVFDLQGRLLAALRHDCGCNDQPASFVVYSDDHGKTWTGGALLPEPGEKFPGMPPGAPNQTNGARGGWTECQVRRSFAVLSFIGPVFFRFPSPIPARTVMYRNSADRCPFWAPV